MHSATSLFVHVIDNSLITSVAICWTSDMIAPIPPRGQMRDLNPPAVETDHPRCCSLPKCISGCCNRGPKARAQRGRRCKDMAGSDLSGPKIVSSGLCQSGS